MPAPPLILETPDGGVSRATIELTTSQADALHALTFEVSRGWIKLRIGVASNAGDISKEAYGAATLRLEPGVHVLQFTPGAATFYVTVERDSEGVCAVTDMDFIGAEAPLLLPAPWEEDDLWELRSEQSRNVRWFWHPRHEWRAVVRYSNNSWGLIYWRSDDGPFLDAGADTISFTPGDTSGTDVPLEASADVFEPEHIGALWRLSHLGQMVEAAITAEAVFTDDIRVVGIDRDRRFTIEITGTFVASVTLQRSVGAPGSWADVSSHTYTAPATVLFEDDFDNAIIYYRIGVKSGNYTSGTVNVRLVYSGGETTGVGRIVDVSDERNVTIDILTPFASTDATRYWAEGAWSAVRGWPKAGGLYDGRLWVGATLSLWGSKPDDFASFAAGEEDDDALSREIAVGDASPLVWIMGAFRLQIGTDAGAADISPVRIGDGAGLQVRSSAFDEPITPTNVTMRDVSAKIAYVDAARTKVFRLTYDLDTNSFFGDDLCRLHESIAGVGGFVDLCYQARAKPRLWLPRADGQLACLTLAEAEQVVGWSRIVLGAGSLRYAEIETAIEAEEDGWEDERAAVVESACTTPGVASGDTDQDFVHLMVARTLNGRFVRCHERIERDRWEDAADAWHVECGLKYDGEPTRYLTGLDHLVGETVPVWGDGAQYGTFEVGLMSEIAPSAGFEDGEIGIDLGEGVEVSKAIVGLAMRTRYMSGKLPYGAQAGSAVGEKKSADHVTVLFYKTALGGVLYGVADANDQGGPAVWFDETKLLRPPDVVPALARLDDPAFLYSGELELPLKISNMRDPRIVFVFDGAGPAAILGYVVNLVTNERP